MRRSFSLLVALLCSLRALPETQNPFQRPECKGVIHGTVFDAGDPRMNVKVVAWPLGIGLAVILPQTETDQAGRYVFQNVCPGKYTVLVDETYSSPGLNEFLYASPVSELTVTDTKAEAELILYVRPKPATMRIHVTNQRTKAEVPTFSVKLRVPGQQIRPEISFDFNPTIRDPEVPLPPGKDVLFHVKAKGFHEWREGSAQRKLIRLASASEATLEVVLEPK